MKLKSLMLTFLLSAGIVASAHDFSATVNGQRLYFNITSKTDKTAAVTFEGSITSKKDPAISGVVEIPAKVKFDNTVYNITSIGQKAFAGAKHLKGIIIPSGIETIGDFAFENCDSLTSVVFPGNPVTLGQGVFFNCTQIADITIGSDWKSVDFTMFRWSDKLTTINVPAKIDKIVGVKKLKNLTTINVDPNNSKLMSDNGMLYSKDGSTLYACPRAYNGYVIIRDGTSTVYNGALIDCVNVSYIYFPASIKKVSFRETSRMKGLETIVMRAEEPISTGYLKGNGKFFFQLCNSKTTIIVPSDSKKKYIEALATDENEYSESSDGVPYSLTKAELPVSKNFKGVNNFDNY